MKKITTLLTFLMLMCMGAWAEDVTSITDGVYYIHNDNSSDKYVSNTYVCKTTSAYGCQFYIKQVTHDNKTCYTIFNLDNDAYVNYKNAETGTTKLESGALGDKSYWDITFVSGTAFTISPQGTSVSWNFWNGNSDNNPVGLYSNGDGNSKWRFEKVNIVSSATGFGNFKYTVSSSNRGSWAVNGASATQLSSTGSLSLAASQTDTKQQFAFVSSNDKYYLYSVVAKKFVLKNGSLVEGPTSSISVDPLTVTTTGNSNYPLFFKFDDTHNINLGGNKQIAINGWGDIDEGNSMAVLPAGNYDLTDAINVLKGAVTVTYKVVAEANGTPLTTEDVVSYRGRSLAVPSSLERAFCTYTLYSDAACTTPITAIAANYVGTTLTVYAKYDISSLPFVPSADFENANWYYLRMRQGGYNVKYAAGGSYYPLEAIASFTKADKDKCSWAFIGNPIDGYEIVNKAAGSTMTLYAGDSPANGTYPLMDSEKTTKWVVNGNPKNGESGAFGLQVPNKSLYINDYAGAKKLSYWQDNATNDAGSTFTVEEMPDALYDITYVLPNTGIADATVITKGNDALAAPSGWNRDGVTFSYYSAYSDGVFSSPVTTATADATVYVDYEYSLSSLLSESTSSLNWYRLYCSGNSGNDYDLFYNGTAPYPFVIQSEFTGSDGYFWAFVGNPFDGVEIYNKAVTTENTLIYNDATNPVMGAEDDTRWYITISNNKIGFQYTGNTAKRLNDYGGNAGSLKYYSSESWFEYTAYGDIDYSDLVTANIQPYITNYGDGYFRINESYASDLSDAITDAETDGINASEYATLLAALNEGIKKPSAGYYRIKSKGSRDSGTPTYIACTNGESLKTTTASNEASSIVKLTGTYPNFRLSIEGKNVQLFEYSYGALATVSDAEGSLHTFDIIEPGYVTILNRAPLYFFESGSHTVTAQPVSGDYTSWTLEPVTSLTITLNPDNTESPSNYYATLYLPFDATISGADAFTLGVSGNYAVPGTITDNEVPAGTAVLLKGSTSSATATINTGDAFNSGSPLDTDLSGVYANTTLVTDGTIDGDRDYFLGRNDGVMGFYHWAGSTLGANRAYLPAANVPAAASRGFSIKWNDDVTGIETIGQSDNLRFDKGIYDLQGRRVSSSATRNSNLPKGLYIVNGKKVVIK